jgi:hypothetical protein
MESALPNLLVIGAMKSGTSALHRMLGEHPAVSMAPVKEVNFFIGQDHSGSGTDTLWREGQWCRGLAWYSSLFDGSLPVRGEASPGYTSPDHGEAPPRIAAVVPDVRLVYLVRDPADRAFSQYLHHAREGAETRGPEEALMDSESQYLSRSRYHARLAPYLERFRRDQILVVVQERLRDRPAGELDAILRHVGLPGTSDRPVTAGSPPSPSSHHLPDSLRHRIYGAVAEDVGRLRTLMDDPLTEWAC